MRADPEQERKRLAETYSQMSDGELEQLAEDLESLTAPARHALRDEIAHRGLVFLNSQESDEDEESAEAPDEVAETAEAPDEVAETAEDSFPELVTVTTFRGEGGMQALMRAKARLEAAGIETFVEIVLEVKAEQAEAAARILGVQDGSGGMFPSLSSDSPQY